ncbi:uncharacterized protein LOC23687870 [Aedes aegypti]|uniref:Gustatory receptor n=1 Tax=Aedes aegypti TaxID=7159 RepID=A0A6I8TT11_AEDAE|nr:gustatory receptor 60 isoform Gr60d [Aedes aegypti]
MFWTGATDSVWYSIAPCELVTKCLGLTPIFTGMELKCWQGCVNQTHLFLTFAFMLRTYWNCLSKDLVYETGSQIFNESGNIIVIMFYLLPVGCVAFSRCVAGEIYRIVATIDSVDCGMRELGVQIDHGQQRRMVLKILSLTISGIMVSIMWFPVNHWDVELEYGLESVIFTVHFSVIFVYVATLSLLLAKRNITLNETFRMYFPVNSTPNGFSTSPGYLEMVVCNEKEQLVALRQIKVLHDKLNDVVELVNYCFAVQITFCVGLCFVIGVVCSFGLFKTLLYWDELYYMGLLNFVWYLYYLFFVLFFIAIGSKVTREGKQMGILVHKAINCSTSSVVINELNIFSQQLLHRSPVITCGLFVYDWTLLYTMIGATATYLIILIQFDVSFPSPTSLNDTVPYKG